MPQHGFNDLVKACIYFISILFCMSVGYWFGRRKWNAYRSTVYSYQMEDITNDEETVHINTNQNIPYTDDMNYDETINELEFKNIFLQAKLRRAEEDLKEKEVVWLLTNILSKSPGTKNLLQFRFEIARRLN